MDRFQSHPDELLSASLTDELTDAERARIEAHLAICERCREMLAAFQDQRRLLSGMRYVPPPRDLSDRVGRGVAAGVEETPRWRRPLAVVAAVGAVSVAAAGVLLAVVLTGEPLEPPVGATGSPDVTGPVATATFTAAPTPAATPSPVLAAGETGYLSLTGTNVDQSLVLRREGIAGADAAVAELRSAVGPPVAAVLSPDAQWLAYQTTEGLKGTNHGWIVRLADGHTIDLGETPGDPFGEQMAWFGASKRLLAYTGVTEEPAGATTDVQVVDTVTGAQVNVTNNGAAYVGSFVPNTDLLWVSVAGSNPNSFLVDLTPTDAGVAPADLSTLTPVSGVFQPIVNPSGDRVIFWRGTMAGEAPFRYFDSGGTLLVEEAVDDRFSWEGEPIFEHLVAGDTVNDPNLLTSAALGWAPDGDTFAVWRVQFQGQGGEAITFPHPALLYVGRVSTGEPLNEESFSYGDRFAETPGTQIVDVEFDGLDALLVTVQLDAGSEGDANAPVPTAIVIRVDLADGSEQSLEGPEGWNGPAIHVEDAPD